MISPSSGIFSPAHQHDLALAHLLDGQVHGWPSRMTRAARGCRPIRRWMAAPVRPLARASSMRPSRISVTMTAAASK